MLCRQELCARLARFPQVDLGHYPTPLEHCPRLSRALGGPTIYIKREDCSGLDVGGNKTRQLRYLLPGALAAGADVLLAGSATQSNWCRQTSAAAARFGFDAFLLLAHGVKGPVLQGNLLLDHVLGAQVEIIEIDDLDAALDAELEIRAEKIRTAGLEAIKLVARTEAILLDPVYSSKAMACLIDHIRTGRIGSDETVVFVHTGGVPALFAYAAEVSDAL